MPSTVASQFVGENVSLDSVSYWKTAAGEGLFVCLFFLFAQFVGGGCDWWVLVPHASSALRGVLDALEEDLEPSIYQLHCVHEWMKNDPSSSNSFIHSNAPASVP